VSSQETAPPLGGSGLPAGLEALSSLAVRVLNQHTNHNHADLCAVCGCAWPCERAVLADHNLAAAL
jgi:hypothetical protein